MRHYIQVCIISCHLLFISCQKNGIKKEVEDFMSIPVTLNLDSMENATILHGGRPHLKGIIKPEYTYVDYIDSTKCTECAIKHLPEWISIMESVSQKGINMRFAFIIAPPKNLINDVDSILTMEPELNDCIYLDYRGIMEKRNPHLPKSKMLHTFLLDKEGDVLLVGNPIGNQKIRDLMYKIINDKASPKIY